LTNALNNFIYNCDYQFIATFRKRIEILWALSCNRYLQSWAENDDMFPYVLQHD